MKKYLMLVAFLMLNTQLSIANAQQVPIELAPLSLWKEQKFVDETDYSIVDDNGITVIKAQSNAAASMLLQEIPVDLTKTPYINWQWKVENTIAKEDEKAKAGDDYPARIYIAVPNSLFSLYPRALNYVWASQSEQNTHWENPYTDDVIMLAVQNGEENVGQWVTEKRNLREDLEKVFGKDFKNIQGIAIMTDTDNLEAEATAFYKNIYFSEN